MKVGVSKTEVIAKVLVTSGSDFIRSEMIRHIWVNAEFEIVNLDNLTYKGNFDSLGTFKDHSLYFFEQADIF